MMQSKYKITFILTILTGFFVNFEVLSQVNPDSIRMIDYHVHIFSPELLKNLDLQGITFNKNVFQVIKEKEAYSDIFEISKDNQDAKMVLISVGYAYRNINNGINEREFVKKENNLLAEIVKTNPDNLLGFYGVDPLMDFAKEEIIRCDEDLQLDGLKIHLQANQFNCKDSSQLAKLKEIFVLADERDIPILIHNSAWQDSSGMEYFKTLEKEILKNSNSLTIIFAHAGGGGGLMPFMFEFLEEFHRYKNENQEHKKHKIFFELSGVVPIFPFTIPGNKSKEHLVFLMNKIGLDNFLFGSDYPVRNSPTYFSELKQLPGIDQEKLIKMVQRNIFSELRKTTRKD